jgi:hypothetical protein
MTSSSETARVRIYEAWPVKAEKWLCPDRGEIPPAAAETAKAAVGRQPFSLPDNLDPGLQRVHIYWQSLRRRNAAIPVYDDSELRDAEQISRTIFLIEVLENPARFRFNFVASRIVRCYGGELAGAFAGEIHARAPLNYLLSQCTATLESQAPSLYRHLPCNPCEGGYERAFFPFWADGRVNMILGAVSMSAGAEST